MYFVVKNNTLSLLNSPLFSEESELELILEDLGPLFRDVRTVKLSSGWLIASLSISPSSSSSNCDGGG